MMILAILTVLFGFLSTLLFVIAFLAEYFKQDKIKKIFIYCFIPTMCMYAILYIVSAFLVEFALYCSNVPLHIFALITLFAIVIPLQAV